MEKIMISNTVFQYLSEIVKQNCIVRFNLAWCTLDQVQAFLELNTEYLCEILLDMPRDRKKINFGSDSINAVYDFAETFSCDVAISNIRDYGDYKSHCEDNINIIPKIEHINMSSIVKLKKFINNLWLYNTMPQYVIIDKENLFTNSGLEPDEFSTLLDKIKREFMSNDIKTYILSGNMPQRRIYQ